MAYGMFLIDRQKFLDLDLRADHFDIEWEVLIKAKRGGLRIARVPAQEASRIHGRSHLTYPRDGRLIFKTAIREGFRALWERIANGRRSADVRP
jgi:hypothetical protein